MASGEEAQRGVLRFGIGRGGRAGASPRRIGRSFAGKGGTRRATAIVKVKAAHFASPPSAFSGLAFSLQSGAVRRCSGAAPLILGLGFLALCLRSSALLSPPHWLHGCMRRVSAPWSAPHAYATRAWPGSSIPVHAFATVRYTVRENATETPGPRGGRSGTPPVGPGGTGNVSWGLGGGDNLFYRRTLLTRLGRGCMIKGIVICFVSTE